MSTATDATPRRHGRLRWIAVAAVVVTAAVLAVVLRGLGSGAPAKPPTLQNQLASRVVTILEQSTPAQHHDHGHADVGEAGTVICAAKTLGFDPPGATTLAEVRTFYGYHLCAVAEPGRPWDFSTKLSGPLSVQLTEPPVVRVAEGGEGYPDRVREIIPTPYQEQALQALLDEDDARELRRRFDKAARS